MKQAKFRKNRVLKCVFSAATLFSMCFPGFAVRANDIVATDDLVGGASVFVFRGSRKRPQERAGAAARAGGGAAASRAQVNAQITVNRKKKAAAAQARKAQIAKARARARTAKIRLSNTLTARAETLMETGDITAASTNFRQALTANPKNTDAITGLSEALTAMGIEMAGDNFNEAAAPYFDEAVKLNSRNEIAFAKLGEIHDAKGRNKLAIANYAKALAIDPEFSSLYMPIGIAYAEAGDSSNAEIFLAKAEALGGDAADARFARGMLLYKQNKYPEALAVFDRIAASEPDNAEAQYQRAVIYDRLQQTDKAIEAYMQSIRIRPLNSLAWFDIGVIHYNKGDYKNALSAYTESIRIDGSNAKAHANLASTYRQLERYAEANAEYKIAAETIKNDPDLYSEWGFCLGKVNDWEKAAARLETARSMSPTAVDDTNAGWAYYNKAQEDKKNKRDAEAAVNLAAAKESHKKALEKDPTLDAAYLNLGSTHNSLGEHEEAVTALNQAVTLHSDWAIAHNQLGLAYRGTDNLSLALIQFNRVVLIDGNNVIGLFNLGSTQYAAGDKKEAKKTQARLKKLDSALAERLANVIAGRLVDEGIRRIKNKIRIPGIPF